MKKTVKNRFLSIVLSAALVLGGAAPAYAVEGTGPDDAGAFAEAVQLDENGIASDDDGLQDEEQQLMKKMQRMRYLMIRILMKRAYSMKRKCRSVTLQSLTRTAFTREQVTAIRKVRSY